MTDKTKKLNDTSKNIVSIFQAEQSSPKNNTYSLEAKTLKEGIKNIKNGTFPQPNNEEIDGQYLRELLDRKRHEHDPDYISDIPIYETKKYKEQAKLNSILDKEYEKISKHLGFEQFVQTKIQNEKSKKIPSLKLIQQYERAIIGHRSHLDLKEIERELLED